MCLQSVCVKESTKVALIQEVVNQMDDHQRRLDDMSIGGNDMLERPEVGEEESSRDEDGVQEGSDQSCPDSVDVMQDEVEDLERRSEDPDNEDVDEGEDDRPDKSQWKSNDSGNDSVEPESDSREDQEGQSPDELESLTCISLCKNVFEVQVDVSIDLLVVSIHDV